MPPRSPLPPSQPNPPAPKSSSSTELTHALLARAHSPASAARIHAEKIKFRPLHLKPSSSGNEPSSSGRDSRRRARLQGLAARRRRLKPPPLSAREKRALRVYEIPKPEQRWCLYAPLNHLWCGYVAELVRDAGGMPAAAGAGNGGERGPVAHAALSRLASADFHGAELLVVRSRCVGRVGLKGIVVRDSKFAFVLVTERDEVKVVPKEHTVFRFEVPLPSSSGASGKSGEEGGKGEVGASANEKNLVFELYGDQFQYRATDRANKKFKSHFLLDL
jgi:ribonuclease P protein subunit POP4